MEVEVECREGCADSESPPDHVPRDFSVAEESLPDFGEESCLWSFECLRPDGVAFVEQVDDGGDDQGCHDDCDDLRSLLFPRRGAEDVPGFEVVTGVTTGCCCDADHPCNYHDGDDGFFAGHSNRCRDDGGDEEGADDHSAHRVIGAADEANDVGGHGDEEACAG